MNHASLFSGIGGFDLAAHWTGWDNVFHCEWNEFGQKVLKYYWPNAESYDDITKTDFTIWGGKIDILTGGFPCQPYSMAGKRKGKEDERHLWPEMLRAIREIKPRYVVGENVSGLLSWNGGLVFNEVQADLEAEGYKVQPCVLPACAVNAPHRRDRVWFVAYANKCTTGPSGASNKTQSNGSENNDEPKSGRQQAEQHSGCSDVYGIATDSKSNGDRRRLRQLESENGCKRESEERRKNNLQFGNNGKKRNATDTNSRKRRKGRMHQAGSKETERNLSTLDTRKTRGNWEVFPTQPPICSGNDGISRELDGITFPKWRSESIKAYGNAIVPHVAYQIFMAIKKTEDGYNSINGL